MALKLKIALSWAALLWERLYAAFWPVISLLAGFVALSWLGFFLLVGAVVHLALLLAASIALSFLAWKGAQGFEFPGVTDAQRRLERDSGLKHRPLRSLHDAPSGDQDPQSPIWQKHAQWLRQRLSGLRPGPPKPEIARRDPRALRIAAGLLLIASAIVAQDRWIARLEHALTPGWPGSPAATETTALEIWIAPPEYTKLAPVFPLKAEKAPLKVPVGSRLEIHVAGGFRTPVLLLDGKKEKLTPTGARGYEIKKDLTNAKRIELHQGWSDLGGWDITLIPDKAPEISVSASPEGDPDGQLHIPIDARDDYGVRTLSAQIVLQGENAPPPETLDLPAIAESRKIQTRLTRDIGAHKWAGHPARLTVFAADAAGHKSASVPVDITLPEKIFENPVARELAEARKDLFINGDAARAAVVEVVENVQSDPTAFRSHAGTSLILRAASARLRYDLKPGALDGAAELLWHAALWIEDGDAALAERQFLDAAQDLMEKMSQGKSNDAELAAAVEKMQEALGRYLVETLKDVLARLSKDGARPDLPPELAQRILDTSELGAFLNHLKHLIKNGRMDEAQKMISALKDSIENTDMKAAGELSQSQAQTLEALERLRKLIPRQQKLIDDTYTLPEKAPELSWTQNSLRVELSHIARLLAETQPEPPAALNAADRNMSLAESKLRLHQPQEALVPEKAALEELQNLLKDQAQQLAQKMAGSLGFLPRSAGIGGENRDPLGRDRGKGWMGESGVTLPDRAQIEKAQKILEELRNRANDTLRPRRERDYIDRLLEMF